VPVPGLSLAGFLDQRQAIEHFRQDCVPASLDEQALSAEWAAAKSMLGAPIPRYGQPEIEALPPSAGDHIRAVQEAPWATAFFADQHFSPAKFANVEIDPLLSTAFTAHWCPTVSIAHSERVPILETPPSFSECLDICLPLAAPPPEFSALVQPSALLLKGANLNLRLVQHGVFSNRLAGVFVGTSVPLVQVVRLNGSYMLWNGYHRAYALRRRGATHMPCMLRDILNPALMDEGLPAPLNLPLLQSDNPPTVAHFTRGRAYPVRLRLKSRVVHVSWAEWVVTEELNPPPGSAS
jgi:hypothetical protein